MGGKRCIAINLQTSWTYCKTQRYNEIIFKHHAENSHLIGESQVLQSRNKGRLPSFPIPSLCYIQLYQSRSRIYASFPWSLLQWFLPFHLDIQGPEDAVQPRAIRLLNSELNLLNPRPPSSCQQIKNWFTELIPEMSICFNKNLNRELRCCIELDEVCDVIGTRPGWESEDLYTKTDSFFIGLMALSRLPTLNIYFLLCEIGKIIPALPTCLELLARSNKNNIM